MMMMINVFQYVATVVLNQEEIGKNSQNIKH